MSSSGTNGALVRLADNTVVRVVAWYVLLFGAAALLVDRVPGAWAWLDGGLPQGAAEVSAGLHGALTGAQAPLPDRRTGLPVTEVFAMFAAFALMLPVTWIYIMTRRRKGFRQSVVQTLLILPMVVAGVVFLVKNSLALAFSLGGIVAAVSFRNTLRDTKDAVYIFLAIGVGLAAGVQSVALAAALSVTFNVVILILWWTDFGRAPVHLQGPPAQRRLRRALAAADRPDALVSVLDDQILKSLTPDQLDAVAERARRRRRDGESKPKPARRLELRVNGRVEDARRAAESVLEESTKRWEFVRATRDPAGGDVLEYRVRLRKSVPAETLIRNLRADAAPQVTGVELA